MSKFINQDYKALYKTYKKMPAIVSIVIAVLMFVWSIVDVSVFQYATGRYYAYTTYYGVMRIKSAFAALVIWWAIGTFVVILIHFFCSLAISPIVVRTDAVLEIKSKLIGDPDNEKEDIKTVIDTENKEDDDQSIQE